MKAGDWTVRKDIARRVSEAAIKAVDPYEAVSRCFHLEGGVLTAGERTYDLNQIDRVLVVGAGKAAAPMAAAVEDVLGVCLPGKRMTGLVNVKYGHVRPTRIIEVNEAGHPVPDERGLKGTRRMAELLRTAGPRDLVINLLSGGGSALLVLPAEGITLEDKRQTTDLLLRCGATINEVNCVRKHLSLSKGGNWARLAQPAPVISLILSDVVGSPLDVIASGPTAPDTSTLAEACRVLEKYDITTLVPPAVRARLCRRHDASLIENPAAGDPVFEQVNNVIVGSNEIAAQAAVEKARELGFAAMLLSTYVEGEAREVARVLAAVAKEIARPGQPLERPCCVVAGGETTVTVKGQGLGGRNQELALAAALAVEGWAEVMIWSLATDGNDGPTEAAGAIVSGETVDRGRCLGLEAGEYLADNDSYEFFRRLGDLIVTGPTNTNVNDLMFVVVF